MQRIKATCVVSCLLAAVTVPLLLYAQEKAEGDDKKKAVEEMALHAEQAYQAFLAAYEADTTTLDQVYDWSLRWMQAKRRIAKDVDGEREAIMAHMKRMLDLYRRIHNLRDLQARGGEAANVHASEYYVAEAKDMLNQLEK